MDKLIEWIIANLGYMDIGYILCLCFLACMIDTNRLLIRKLEKTLEIVGKNSMSNRNRIKELEKK
jgi:hypothetical protein